MEINDDVVALRDIVSGDIDDYRRWETVETEWQQWDAPWEHEGLSEEQRSRELRAYLDVLEQRVRTDANRTDDEFRNRFEIDYLGGSGAAPVHVGWCASYLVDKACDIVRFSDDGGANDVLGRAVGIDVCETAMRGRGVATHALELFIAYLQEHEGLPILTQTWSGNLRMIGLAEKLGFVEIRRKPGIRQVRGRVYDGLTFMYMKEREG